MASLISSVMTPPFIGLNSSLEDRRLCSIRIFWGIYVLFDLFLWEGMDVDYLDDHVDLGLSLSQPHEINFAYIQVRLAFIKVVFTVGLRKMS